MRLTFSLIASLSFVAACSTSSSHRYDYSVEPDPRRSGFVLGPSDEVNINVWRNPDLSGRALVRPDGTITMPLVGDLQAAGRTPRELRNEIEQRLGAFIKGQTVTITVAVTQVNSYAFTITGNVNTPGLYSAQRYVTVQEGIAMAGGLTRFVSGEHSVIVRSEGGTTRRIPVNYKAIIAGAHAEQNLILLRGDVVVVE